MPDHDRDCMNNIFELMMLFVTSATARSICRRKPHGMSSTKRVCWPKDGRQRMMSLRPTRNISRGLKAKRQRMIVLKECVGKRKSHQSTVSPRRDKAILVGADGNIASFWRKECLGSGMMILRRRFVDSWSSDLHIYLLSWVWSTFSRVPFPGCLFPGRASVDGVSSDLGRFSERFSVFLPFVWLLLFFLTTSS